MIETEEIDEYILRHIDKEGDYLYRLYRATNVEMLRPRMASGHLQGRLLKMLVRMICPDYILEIGTYTGYSALSMAEGLEAGGKVITFEVNDEQEDFTRPWIERAAVADKVEFIIGDALELVPEMVEKRHFLFDMAFVDGDKRRYADYYEMVLKVLRPGGFMLVDNTLWDGHVVDEEYAVTDPQTKGIIDFNDFVAQDDRVEKVILPLRDGLTLIRKNR